MIQYLALELQAQCRDLCFALGEAPLGLLDDAFQLGVAELHDYGVGFDRGTRPQHELFDTSRGLGRNPAIVPWE